MTDRPSRILRPLEAAQHLGLSVSTLAKRRIRGDKPEYVKISRKAVGYRLADLDDWLASCVRRSTSDLGG